jgi:hypothetical protein
MEGGVRLNCVAICEGVGGRERKWAIGSAMTSLSLLPRRALLGVLPLVLETIKTFEASLFGLSKSIGFEPPLISWPFLLFVFLFFPQPRAGGTKTI